MDILVIGSDGAERCRTFLQHAGAAGHRVRVVGPGESVPTAGDAWLGLVCFDPECVPPLLDDTRYLSASLIVLSAQPRPASVGATEWYAPETPDALLLQELTARCEIAPVSADVRAQVAEPLTTAVQQTLVEMAGVEAAARSVYQRATPTMLGDVSALLAIKGSVEGFLMLGFSTQAAAIVSRRVFAETKQELTPAMIQDCIGEIANVVAGQAKALLAGTPYHFAFSPPVPTAENVIRSNPSGNTLVIAFSSDVGNLALQLHHRP